MKQTGLRGRGGPGESTENWLGIYLLYIYECSACMYVVHHVSSQCHGNQKRELDLLELELSLVVSHCAKAASALHC